MFPLKVRVSHNLVRNHLPCLLEHLNVSLVSAFALRFHSTLSLGPFFSLECTVASQSGATVRWWPRCEGRCDETGCTLAHPGSPAPVMESHPLSPSPSCEFSLTHLYFWLTIHGEHLNASHCPEWLRTANLKLPFTIRFRGLERVGSKCLYSWR